MDDADRGIIGELNLPATAIAKQRKDDIDRLSFDASLVQST